jgi:hypothetical protein
VQDEPTRPVPVAIEAERRILGAMMLGAAETASQHLTPADFIDHRHARIYDHVLELWGAGEPTDPVAVLKRLADRGELTRSDTGVYLHTLIEQACDHPQIGYYARIVLDEADRRRTATLGARLTQAAEISDAETRRLKVAEVLAEGTSGAREADSWAPINLTPYIDGTHQRPEPTIGITRQDGLQLLYPGKEHAVIGEMESGKSWVSLACVAAELNADRTVVYIHFEEADPADSVERLLTLGVPGWRITAGFKFVGPTSPVTPDRIARLLDPAPSLVVLDGQNEGMALHAQAIREEDGAAAFRKLLVKPWCEAGAAVLSCDHVVKDKEARGRYALGSIHKGNALNGSLILLENDNPFGRGQRGTSRVYVVKDRPGYLRRHGQGTKTSGKTYLGQVVVDDTRRYHNALDLAFLPPADDVPEPDRVAFRSPLDQWILTAIAGEPEQSVPSKRILFAVMRKNGYHVRDTEIMSAVDDLLVSGQLTEIKGGRSAQGFRITTTTTASQDQTQLPI